MKRRAEAVPAGTVAPVACVVGAVAYVLVVAGATAADRAQYDFADTVDVCATWAQEILEGNLVRSALYQEQFSHYSPRTNRCFVEMRVQTGELNERSDRFGQYLYDGQNREMLAFAEIQNGKKSGRVFDLYHHTTSFENAGWDDASQYIYIMMAGDRW
jgi:hypothetical protein